MEIQLTGNPHCVCGIASMCAATQDNEVKYVHSVGTVSN